LCSDHRHVQLVSIRDLAIHELGVDSSMPIRAAFFRYQRFGRQANSSVVASGLTLEEALRAAEQWLEQLELLSLKQIWCDLATQSPPKTGGTA